MKLSDDFFKREIRCGFEIDEMMKRAWAAQLEVLELVDSICQKHNIQYFADFGTLIGVVRHSGFIPWDDDIDICLKREDYNKLIKVLREELPYGFSLAGMYADSKRLQDAAFTQQIRVIADETEWNFNDYMKRFHGFPYQRVGIDIFPLDYCPRDKDLENMQKEILKYGVITLQHWDEYEKDGVLEQRLQEIEKVCAITLNRNDKIKNQLWKIMDSVSSLYHEDEADELTGFLFYIENDKYHLNKEWYDYALYMKFEDFNMPVPCGYHEILTAIYGDYMTPSKLGLAHDYPFYGHMKDELIKQIRAVGFQGTVEEFCEKVSKGELRV